MQPDPMFEWGVQTGGFRIESGRLLPRAELGGTPGRVYRLSAEEPALFRTFAELPHPLTDEAALQFAVRYGLLGLDEDHRSSAAESLADWRLEHQAMGDAVELMEALVSDRRSQPRETVERLASDRRSRQRIEARLRSDLVPRQRSRSRSQWQLAAQALLAELVEPRLVDGIENVVRLSAGTPPALVMRPRGLVNALWLQLAVAVSEQRTFRRCDGCGRWLDVSSAVGRVDRRYCDTACRMRALRARRETNVH